MSLSSATAAGLETLLNRYLAMDPALPSRLTPLYGRVIALEVLGLGTCWYLIPGPAGIQVLREFEGDPDCTLRGTPLALARMGNEQRRADQLFSGSVEISGNSDLGHRFGNLLASLDIDWEEQLSKLTGDVLAHQAGNLTRDAVAWGRRSSNSLQQNLPEYLQEELRLVPTRLELEEFLAGVDRIRDDLERLEQRITRLRADGKPR